MLVVVLVVVAGSAAYALTRTPRYEASTKIFVSTQSASSVSDLSQGNLFTQQVVRSYANIVATPIVLRGVIEQLNLDQTVDQLAPNVQASAALDTVVIDILVSDEDPETAARIANAVADNLASVVTDLAPTTSGAAAPVKITTVQEATPPTSSSYPNIPLSLVVGLIVGVALALGLALLRAVADTKIRRVEDLAGVTHLPLLGGIYFDPDAGTRPLVVQDRPRSIRAEPFRALRANLQFLDFGGRARSFVFTSALPGEGKSTTVANLAIALASNEVRVVVVDADLRRPRLADLFGIEGAVGLSDVLIEQVALDDALQPWGTTALTILPAGQIPPNPSELLSSSAMESLARLLTERFDVVIIDAPPLLPVIDAAILSKVTGGAVLVAAAGQTHRNQVKGAIKVLDGVNADILGVVLTKLSVKGETGSYGYGGYGETYGDEGDDASSTKTPRAPRRRWGKFSR